MSDPTPTRRWRRLRATLALSLFAGGLLALQGASAGTAAAADVTNGLLLRYDLTQTSGTVVADTSGHGKDGTLVRGAAGGTWSGSQGLALDGVDDYVKLPNNLMTGLSAITVSVDVYVEPSQSNPFFFWGLGNTATSGAGTGYLMTSGNAFRAAITTGNWSGEKVTARSGGGNLARGVWKTVTYTQTGTIGTLFEDGAQVGQSTAVSVLPSQVGAGVTTNNLLGKSSYAADNTFKGKLKNFRIYDRALTPAEVSQISLSDTSRVDSDTAALALGDLSAVTANLTLPTTGAFGSTIAWSSSDPAHLAANGTVTRPGPLDDPADVTLTATVSRGAATQTKTFQASVVPEENEQSKADAAAAALMLVDAGDVRGDLTLPLTGKHGSSVAWATSDAGTVSTSGLVHRPAHGSGDATVTLTATVTVGGATATRAVQLTVREAPAAEEYAGYAFSYFTGNSIAGEKIYFAASRGNNALRWDELNNGQPALESTMGERGLRDPFLIRSPEGDRFFLIATDLSIGRNGDWDRSQRTGSRYLEVWESTDLVHWGHQRHVLVSPETAGNTWAPEAYWDDTTHQYVVFWASKLYAANDTNHTGSTYNRMLYATTRDFVTFSEPQIWQDRGESRIDSTVIKDGGTFYRFTKDEGGGGTGCSDIIQEKSSSLTAVDRPGNPAWTFLQGCIGRGAGTSAVEGPSVFKANPADTSAYDYYLFVDEYGGRGYIPLGAHDLENADWTVPSAYSLPASPRHGTVIPVTQTELDRLRAGVETPDPVQSDADGLIAHLPLSGDADDASGHDYDGVVQGGATFSDGALNLDGSNDYVKLPNNLMTELGAITVSSKVWVDSSQSGNYFFWNLGNTGSDGVGKGYLFATGNSTYRAAIASGNWTTEQGMTSGSAIGRGAWKTVTYTLDGSGTAVLYLDGVEVGRKTGVTITPGDIGGGITKANYLGKSAYSGDGLLKGKVKDFYLYDRALSAGEVADLSDDGTAIRGVTLSSLKVPAIIDSGAGTVTLPVQPGTDLTTLAPAYQVGSGSTASPSGAQDYSAPVTVTVAKAGGASRQWTVTAVEMRSPVIPGLYADPNIAVFDGVYYLYATTDGFAGWGGKEFYVWRSTNLVDWTRSTQPFLTLDGANGNVPWASGNAWAPTVIEKDEKFYFYFSGHNPTYNRKTIGVAVADSPEGPFTAQPTAMVLNNESVTSGQAIDPAAFRDPATGKDYLFWGNGSPVYAELSADMLSLKPGTIKTISGLTSFREGSFVNERNGTYYLTYSIDDTGSADYRVGYATASSVTGPWTYRGVVLQKNAAQGILATGHSSIVNVPGTDDWYIAYHRFAIPGGDGQHRETTIDRLEFNADGTIKPVVPTLGSVDPLEYDGGPTTVVVSDAGDDGWYGADAQLALAGGPGAAGFQYRLDGGAWSAYSAPVDLPAGAYEVDHRARGTNGAWSEVSTLAVKVDTVLPAVSATESGRVVTLTASDADSGVAATEYSLDGGAWMAYTAPVRVDRNTHTVDYRATDVAGNVTTDRVEVAGAGVTATVSSPEDPSADGWYAQTALVRLSADLEPGQKIQYRLGGGPWRTYSTAVTVSATGTTTVGHRIAVKQTPVSGTAGQSVVKVDKVRPLTSRTRTPAGSGTPRNPVTLAFEGSDVGSGLAAVEYRVGGGAWTEVDGPLVLATVGDHVVSYRATDRAGNTSVVRSVAVVIEADPATVLKATPAQPRRGALVTLRLSGFHRHDPVALAFGDRPLPSVTTDVKGAAVATFVVPADAGPGATTITATGSDGTLSATAQVTAR